jgi:hypothetical protein
MTKETISRSEFCEILESNGFAGAASEIHNGADPWETTRYIMEQQPLYDDAEGRWLLGFVTEMPRGYRFSDDD